MIYVFGHCFPFTDLDSLAGSAGLAQLLKKEGREAKAVLLEGAGIKSTSTALMEKCGLRMPVNVSIDEIADEKNEVALVDHNNPYESFARYGLEKKIFLCVDHHYIEDNFRFETLIYKKTGAACTIVAEMYRLHHVKMEDWVAKALFYGIISDTMGLKSIKTSELDRKTVRWLHEEHNIDVSVETVAAEVIDAVDILNMDIDRLLVNSLKEYFEGEIGISRVVVLSDDYLSRMDEILREAGKMEYRLFAYVIYRQHEEKTEVFFFDRHYGVFPEKAVYDGFISRSQELLPMIMEKTGKTRSRGNAVGGGSFSRKDVS